MKGMIASIYSASYNCSNKGISYYHTKVTIVGEGIPELFEPSKDAPAVKLHDKHGYKCFVPDKEVDSGNAGWMFGGCFVYTSDSGFPEQYPIPLHDRQEAPQQSM